ncbi:Druantia anti-phage system protein DruA [Sporotomaculum syntrophicum]|uniref:Druantia anti-phage system protein DruA n=1 Tax=Sporotomaculum syntrophicum TaxID=182264 RepID=UPI003C6F9952
MPVSSGYCRRLRFLVFDNHTNKVMGLLGLGDPVFSLSARDKCIGWTKEKRLTK